MSELSDEKIKELKDKIPVLIGNHIRFLRKEKGISQTELAKLSGKDRQYIYKIEKGIVTSNIVTITLITSALGISLKDFFSKLEEL